MSEALKTIALIASGRCRQTIEEAATREGFVPTSFDCVQAYLDLGELDDPGAIVLSVDETISAAPALIEPLMKLPNPSAVVVVCESIQRWEVRAVLAAGASGVVLYTDLERSLGPCLCAVQVGQVCVPREHWRQIEPPVLSTREKQILGLVVMGYMNSQIADQLYLAESTVKSHLSSAFGKLGVRSRNEAVDLIINPERGLGMGILGLGDECVEPIPMTAR